MKRGFAILVVVSVVFSLLESLRGAESVIISEFMASNLASVEDEDGAFSDWIELYNPGSEAVDLEGYFLTDDPAVLTKWRFPAVSIEPGRFLVVFASSKDRRDPDYELHTNFKLLSAGEFLALVAPDGESIVSSFENFPLQAADVSYGFAQDSRVLSFVRSGASAKVLVPTDGSLGNSWTDPDFTDSDWLGGTTGVGYERSSGYDSLIKLDLESRMYGANCTAYVRIAFTVDDPSAISALKLRMKYDDGFVAYLNGREIARRNAPASLSWNSTASALHDDSAAVVFESFDVYGAVDALRAGKNVLAIHGLNERLQSSDFLILPELDGVEAGTLDTSRALYLTSPTPGWANSSGYPKVSGFPVFSRESGLYDSPFDLTITTEAPGAVIRYVRGWSEPGESSSAYSGPISINGTVMIRARVFEPDAVPGPIVTRSYTVMDSNVRDFNSNLPLIILNTFGRGIGPDGYTGGYAEIFEPDETDGRTRLNGTRNFGGIVGLKQRGSSSAGFPKKMYGMETWDEHGNDEDYPLLGLPSESDWVLYAPYSDKSLMRNALAYGWSNDIDEYAPRTRFVEMFLNTGTGRLNYSHYVGVYLLVEKIKRGEDRVDIRKLVPSDDTEPDISGGYLLKIDRADPGDVGFRTARGTVIRYVSPKEERITPPQKSWIKNYMDGFEAALFGSDFRDPVSGYARWIDPDSWADHFLLTELCKNIDGYRLSTFFYKDRGGKLVMGPIWDYNLSLGNADYLHGWRTDLWYLYENNDPNGWGKWWRRLFQDVDFEQRFIDRWQNFRRSKLSLDRLLGRVDEYASLLAEAQVRNFEKWPILGQRVWPNWYIASTWQAELEWMKNWIRGRVAWIDGHYIDPPEFNRDGGAIESGFELTMTAPSGVIYYTLDGTDPRLPGGAVSPRASVYSVPIVLEENARVFARAKSGIKWSGFTAATFYVDLPQLVVSEIMFHPPDPPAESPYDDNDFEFLELLNRGGTSIDLTGVHFSSGIQFAFPEGMILRPGEYVVLVKNMEAFGSRYDTTGVLIAGEYGGFLENRGERIALSGPLEEPVYEVTYDDQWYPDTTDGRGHSLTCVDPWDPRNLWNEPESWKPSTHPLGSPGGPDSGDPALGGWQLQGDLNQDGALDISDAVGYLRMLFAGTSIDPPCEGDSLSEGGNLKLLDVNADETVDLGDAVYILAYLFSQGPEPEAGTSCIRIKGCPNTNCRQ